jgi:serine/threonine protein kinase
VFAVFENVLRSATSIIAVPSPVPLTPGSRLGPYEITAQIGVGGMGEVYRATDTNLARQVAIKVLPESTAADAERLARFDREAKTLAALKPMFRASRPRMVLEWMTVRYPPGAGERA